MIRNYIKIAGRNIKNNKGYTFLNILGLATGITAAVLIFLWIENEVAYNDYFTNKESIYEVKNIQTYGENVNVFNATPGPLKTNLEKDIPGIANVSSRNYEANLLFSREDKNLKEYGYYVDSEFFSIFNFEFIQGSLSKPFSGLHSLVITESMAEKFFGSTDIIGQSLMVEGKNQYVVSGVIKDLPKNTSLKFNWLAPFENYANQTDGLERWGNNMLVTYVQLEENADLQSINDQLSGYLKSKYETDAKLWLYPMSRWRLFNRFENGQEVDGRITYVRLFFFIAIIILIIACINFMNLATARSEKRAKEIGVRKVMGAQRSRLIYQFLSESIIMAFISTILAVILIYIFLKPFNQLVNQKLSLDFTNSFHVVSLLVIAMISGLLAGSFPSYYLSSFKPVKVLKGKKIKSDGANLIRKGLVVFQFSVSIILIIATIIIFSQINHVKNRDFGLDTDQLLFLPATDNLKKNFAAFKNEILKFNDIEAVAMSRHTPINIHNNSGSIGWEGKRPDQEVLITTEFVSTDYIETTGMKIIQGKDFSPNPETDSLNVIINKQFADLFEHENVIGKYVAYGSTNLNVIGVIDDFMFNNIYGNGMPMLLYSSPSSARYINVRMKKDADISGLLAALESKVKQFDNENPFEYTFANEDLEQFYANENLIGKLARIFAVLAIIISCLGLFGLSAFTAEQRVKEIGIRKVLGANVNNVVALLSKDFLKLVGIACIIAFPVAWWAGNDWLKDYPYRIDISIWIFLVAGIAAIGIALVTVSFQAIKAAMSNPIKNLRTE